MSSLLAVSGMLLSCYKKGMKQSNILQVTFDKERLRSKNVLWEIYPVDLSGLQPFRCLHSQMEGQGKFSLGLLRLKCMTLTDDGTFVSRLFASRRRSTLSHSWWISWHQASPPNVFASWETRCIGGWQSESWQGVKCFHCWPPSQTVKQKTWVSHIETSVRDQQLSKITLIVYRVQGWVQVPRWSFEVTVPTICIFWMLEVVAGLLGASKL